MTGVKKPHVPGTCGMWWSWRLSAESHYIHRLLLIQHFSDLSYIDVIQESTVMYEFSIWIHKKIVFKNKCCVGEEQL